MLCKEWERSGSFPIARNLCVLLQGSDIIYERIMKAENCNGSVKTWRNISLVKLTRVEKKITHIYYFFELEIPYMYASLSLEV